MKIHRLLSILLLIESRKGMKAKELASKFEISLRTVYRDIDTLCEIGIPLRTTSGPNGGVHLMEGYSTGISQLQEEDIIHLYLSGMGIKPDKHSDMAVKINNALLKLEKNLSHKEKNDISKIKNKFYFDEIPWWGEGQRLYNVDTLIESIFKSNVLTIRYKKFQGELSIRKIHPFGIVVKRMEWYVIAYCESAAAIRIFKLERIVDCEITNEHFALPMEFSVEEYWKKAGDAFKDLCMQKEQYPVVLKIHRSREGILTDLTVLEMKEEGEDLLVTVNMYDNQYAVSNIMKNIEYVEVIQPIELRATVKEKLDTIVNKYRKLE